jgi:hypothetical protein
MRARVDTTASQTKLPLKARTAIRAPMKAIELAGVAKRGLTRPNQPGSRPSRPIA